MCIFQNRGRLQLPLAAIAVVTLTFAGCSDAKQRAESSDHLKHLARAVLKYQSDQQAWPEKLDDVQQIVGQDDGMGPIGGGKTFEELIVNPLTGEKRGYEYVKPPETVDAFSTTVVLYQVRAGKRDETLPVAFLDGSVRTSGGGGS